MFACCVDTPKYCAHRFLSISVMAVPVEGPLGYKYRRQSFLKRNTKHQEFPERAIAENKETLYSKHQQYSHSSVTEWTTDERLLFIYKQPSDCAGLRLWPAWLYSVVLHVTRRASDTWERLAYFSFRVDKASQVRCSQQSVSLFALLVSGVAAVGSAAQHTDGGSDGKTTGSVGGPLCVSASSGFSCRSHGCWVLLNFVLKENHL